MKKIAVITTHPIQYYAPLFRELARDGSIHLRVFYTWGNVGEKKFDPGFGKEVSWDIPLLEGYEHTFVKNVAADPGSHHFKGVDNPTLNAEVEAWKPDAVMVIGWAYRSHLKALRYFHKRVPVFFRGESTLLDERSGLKTVFRRAALRWVYSHVSHMFYIGQANKDYCLAHGLKLNQLFYAPHAIDNQRFEKTVADSAGEIQQWRRKLKIPQSSMCVVFAGKFEPKKNPLLLVKAVQPWRNTDGIHLVMVGDGELKEQLIREADHATSIHFIPMQNQSRMPLVYALGDIFCLPSQGPGETWGLAVNEAMACGRAVLVSDRCGCAADLVSPETGRVFQSGNLEDLKAKLSELLKADLAKMGAAAQVYIQDWSIEATAARMLDAFKKVLK